MDTGQKLWRVKFSGATVSFNVLAKDEAVAIARARRCAVDMGARRPNSLQLDSVSFEGTLDEPRRRRRPKS